MTKKQKRKLTDIFETKLDISITNLGYFHCFRIFNKMLQ